MVSMNNLTLHSALLQIQELNVPIRLTPRSVTLWSPNTRVPGALRAIIREHAPEIRDMIQASRIEVCPSPMWHRQEWYFPGEDWTIDTATCGVCDTTLRSKQRFSDGENRS